MSKEDVIRKLNYAKETKEMFKDKLVNRNAGITDATPFSDYPNKIKFLYQTPPKYGAVFQNIMPLLDADGVVYWGEFEPWIFDGVTDENNIVTVEPYAMQGLCINNSGLVEVKLDNLTTIGTYSLSQAFENCINLIKVNLDNLQSIVGTYGMNRLFYNCSQLEDIGNFGRNITGVVYTNGLTEAFYQTKIKVLDLSGVTKANNNAFNSMCKNCTELESVDLSNLVQIDSESMTSAFSGCTKLKTVLVPKLNLAVNGTLANTFSGCTSLESIDLSGITKLGANDNLNDCFTSTFEGCTSLKNVDLSNLIPVNIYSGVFNKTFRNCTALTYNPINISAIELIGDRAFESTFENSGLSGTISFDGLKIATSRNGQSKFASCFANTSNLEEIAFPVLEEGVNGGSASTPGRAYFSTMATSSGIRKISFPQLRTNEVGTCFYRMCMNCANLTDVDFSSLETTSILGLDFQETFRGCTSLEEVRFPALKNIQGANTFQNIFYGCTNLKKIYFNSLETAHASAFNAMFNNQCTSLTEIHFPASSQSLVESLTGYASRFGAPSTCQILFDL